MLYGMCGPNLKSVTLMSYGNFFYCQVLKNEDLVGALGKMIKKLFFEFRSCILMINGILLQLVRATQL